MLIIMRSNASQKSIESVVAFIEEKGFKAHISAGEIHTVIGAVGGKVIDTRDIELLEDVSEVIKITSNYKLVSRTFQNEDTIIEINGTKFGANHIGIIAGPCTIENEEQMDIISSNMKEIGIKLIRGGAFKPRTSPYAFQGFGEAGLKIIRKYADKYGLAIVSEVMEISQIPMFLDYVDVLQIGARNMQNFNLLREVGKVEKPVVLKRGMSSTIEEWLMAAEYILSSGNRKVILCERGIRTFENMTRNTLDLSAIPIVKKLSHLPIIVDPSHGTGLRDKVIPMSRAAIAAGADGLMIEVHNDPEKAVCDGAQSLRIEEFKNLYEDIKKIAPIVDKIF